jgi:dGTP triphosphohydrolase
MDEEIRKPDKVIIEQLIPDDDNDDNNHEARYYNPHNIPENILKSSIECYQNEKIEQDEMERIISSSIEEYIKRQEDENNERKQTLSTLTMRVEKLAFIQGTDNLRRLLKQVINNYIITPNEQTLITKEEYDAIQTFMDDLYTTPKTKSRKTAITEETFDIIMSRIYY